MGLEINHEIVSEWENNVEVKLKEFMEDTEINYDMQNIISQYL